MGPSLVDKASDGKKKLRREESAEGNKCPKEQGIISLKESPPKRGRAQRENDQHCPRGYHSQKPKYV